MCENPDVSPFQFILEKFRCRLMIETGDHDAQNIDALVPEIIDQLESI
jgi:hypothetical protein